MAKAHYVPEAYATVTPYIMVPDARDVLAFTQEVFGARVLRTSERPDGLLGHTELELGDSRIMLADCGSDWPAASGAFYVYVENVDETYRRALEAGARSIMEPADQDYGDRHGGVADAAGNQWWIAAPIRG